MKILKNQTANIISLDIGIGVPASGQIILNPQDYDEAAASDDLVELIGSGDVVVNDGSNDLTKADGIRLIQGGYSHKVQLDDDLLQTDRIKVDVTGSLTSDGVKVSSNDTTADFLEEKIVAQNNKISVTTINDGGDEDLQIGINPSNIGTSELVNDANFLIESTHDALPSDNPHNVNKAQVGLGNVDDTSDEDKPVSLAQQAALDLKYDASNPNGYETPSQLDARDIANRDRSNHTGTQLASTISDFTSAVQAAETTTSLTLVGNNLTYVDEDGTSTVIDLSLYLDDTNLARIVNGTLNSSTGIVTFSRDDGSTFTVDFSPLLNNQTASSVSVSPITNLTATNVQDALAEHQSDIDGINSSITTINSDINTIQSGQITQNNLISNNSSNVTSNAANISANASNIGANSGNISINTSNINSLDTRVTSTENDIIALNLSQTTQNTAIALNTSKISADGSVDTHSDVDTTTIPPQVGSQLTWDGSNWVPQSVDNGFTIFPIWAEEGGGLSDDSYEWSYGNGATGAMGISMGIDCELFALSLNCTSFGTSMQIEVQNDFAGVSTATFTSNNQVVPLTPVPFSQGDLMSFYSLNENGSFQNARVCAWFRVRSTAAFPTPDRSVVNNSFVTFTSGGFSTIPGLSTTVTINDTGTIDGTLVYSASRNTGSNSEAQFRVVINGVAGLSFSDTLSTFNDTGSASFVVSGLPAGTYTVTAEASVNNPIFIESCQLTAVGVED